MLFWYGAVLRWGFCAELGYVLDYAFRKSMDMALGCSSQRQVTSLDRRGFVALSNLKVGLGFGE